MVSTEHEESLERNPINSEELVSTIGFRVFGFPGLLPLRLFGLGDLFLTNQLTIYRGVGGKLQKGTCRLIVVRVLHSASSWLGVGVRERRRYCAVCVCVFYRFLWQVIKKHATHASPEPLRPLRKLPSITQCRYLCPTDIRAPMPFDPPWFWRPCSYCGVGRCPPVRCRPYMYIMILPRQAMAGPSLLSQSGEQIDHVAPRRAQLHWGAGEDPRVAVRVPAPSPHRDSAAYGVHQSRLVLLYPGGALECLRYGGGASVCSCDDMK